MRKIDGNTRKLFRDPQTRRAWILYELKKKGRSGADVAREAGVDRTTLYIAFKSPYPRMEYFIARALDMKPQTLFPERYDANGLPNRGRKPNPHKRGSETIKNTTRRKRRNVQSREAA